MNQGIDLIQTWLGTMVLGAIPTILCPPNTRQNKAQWTTNVRHILQHSGAQSIVLSPTVAKQFSDSAIGGGVSQRLIDSTDLFSGVQKISPEAGNDDLPVLLQHSSGTTGLHKGVALTDSALITQISLYAESLSLAPDTDKIVCWLPFYHDMGLIACLVLPLLTNTELVFMDNFAWVRQPTMLLRAITDFRTTMCWMPNFAYNFLASRINPPAHSFDVTSMRLWINCSEPVKVSSMSSFCDAFKDIGVARSSLATCYAMAENTFAVTQSPVGLPSRNLPPPLNLEPTSPEKFSNSKTDIASSGVPLPNHEVVVRDERGATLPENEIGEICIRSPCLMKEYFNREDLTAQAFNSGWYSTGDLGLFCDGELYVCGRKKDLIIHAGENIFPEEIEGPINDSPEVYSGRTAAFGVYDSEDGTEKIVVLAEVCDQVGPDSTTSKTAREIKRRVYEATGHNVREVHLLPHRTLAKSSSGKISRDRCRQYYLEHLENTDPC